jgi:tetratricopeptide (TPR) repeat protein
LRSSVIKLQLQHPMSVPVLLVAVIVALYYPSLLSGFHCVDDPGIVALYAASPPLSQILLPGSGYYYRPLLEMSYWLDNRFWGMLPSVMHLENILLHCANSLLLFALARRVHPGAPGRFPAIPLFAALLFALHPVNVEAVSWIAGRSDPLLALMVLSACHFWLRWLEAPRWQDLAAALSLFGAALLTKETSLAAGAVALLLAAVWPGKATQRARIAALSVMTAAALLMVICALFFRPGASGLSRFTSASDLHLGQGIWEALTAYGFYASKLLVPVPLNFAITEVDPLHALAAVVFLPVLVWLLLRRSIMGVMFASAALLALPAVLVAVKQIAWTPFAERYMYLPSAFCALGLAALIGSDRNRRFRGALVLILTLVLAGFACISLQRTLLWKDTYAFMQDSVAKSPGFGSLYNDLGVLLMQRGEHDRASDAFAAADRLNKRSSMHLLIKGNLLRAQLAKGDDMGVRTGFFQLFREKQEAPADFLELLYKADTARLARLTGAAAIVLARDLLETVDLLHQKRYDPFWLYRSGQLSLVTGDEARAAEFFSRSYTAAPVDAHYRKAAEIYARKFGPVK